MAETAAAPGHGQEQGTRTGCESEGQALLSHQLPPCTAERKSKSPPCGCGIMTRPALFSFKMCIIIAIINNNSVTSVTGVHRTPDLRLGGCDSVGTGPGLQDMTFPFASSGVLFSFYFFHLFPAQDFLLLFLVKCNRRLGACIYMVQFNGIFF